MTTFPSDLSSYADFIRSLENGRHGNLVFMTAIRSRFTAIATVEPNRVGELVVDPIFVSVDEHPRPRLTFANAFQPIGQFINQGKEGLRHAFLR